MSSGSRGVRASDKSTKTADHTTNNSITDKKMKTATADQIRLAQITENNHDYGLQENIDQFMAITGKNREDASIILHDHGNDLQAALNANYEGDTNLDAWHETTKKKKSKAKIELENKENRKNASESNRERSASRGRGGGAGGVRGNRGRREVPTEGGRGGGSRRGRITNGGGPMGGRGRGGRSIRGGRGGATGRGSSQQFSDESYNRSNHMRQPPIDIWNEESDIIDNQTCQIEEWNDEWTGSLDKTNVFVHSAADPVPPPASDLTAIDAAKLVNSSPLLQSSYNNESTAGNSAPQSYSSAASQAVVPPSNLGGLVPNQASQTQSSLGGLAALLQQAAPQSMLSSSASVTSNGKVPHLQQQTQPTQQPSILGGISTNVGDVIKASSNSNSSVQYSGSTAPAPTAASLSNNFQSSQHNSIFSTNLQNTVSRNTTTSATPAKPPGVILPPAVSMPTATGNVLPRAKPTKPKPNQSSSKIPLSAVEMPDDVMSAINLRMTGLQFGSEGFDFLNDKLPPSSSSVTVPKLNEKSKVVPSYTAPTNNSYATPPPTVAGGSNYQTSYGAPPTGSGLEKSLSQATQQTSKPTASLSQTQKLGPEPIPFPNQMTTGSNSSTSSNTNSNSNNSSGTNSQSSSLEMKSNSVVGVVESSNASASVGVGSSSSNWRTAQPPSHHVVSHPPPSSNPSAVSQKKDVSINSNSGSSHHHTAPPSSGLASSGLGNLVGGSSSNYSYSLPKTSTTFPSPPTAHYSQNNVQNSYSSNAPANDSGTSGYGSATNNQSASSNANSSNSANNPSSTASQQTSYGSQSAGNYSAQNYNNSNQSTSVQYQNNYNTSSHSSVSGGNLSKTPQLNVSSSSMKDNSSYAPPSEAPSSSNTSGTTSSITNSSAPPSSVVVPPQTTPAGSTSLSSLQHQQKVPAPVTSGPPPGTVNKGLSGVGIPPGVQHHTSQPQHMSAHAQQQVPNVAAQQQMLAVQQQQQYVGSNAALQGTLPFYGIQQPAMYSFEELQALHRGMSHLPQAPVPPSTMAGSRDTSMGGDASGYSAGTAVNKFRTDQNSSPVPNSINTQGGHTGYIPNAAGSAAATAAAAIHPMYMYHQNMAPAMPSSAFPQHFATQAIIQLPPNTAGSTTSQYQPAGAKLQQYGTGAGGPAAYYDSQGAGDFKGNYGTAAVSQTQSKANSNVASSMANSVSDYKNHINKSYEKPTAAATAFHTSTPPPFNMAGSAGAPYAQVYLPQLPHQSALMHHPLHQDGSNSGSQRGTSGTVQNKTASKAQYQAQFWSS